MYKPTCILYPSNGIKNVFFLFFSSENTLKGVKLRIIITTNKVSVLKWSEIKIEIQGNVLLRNRVQNARRKVLGENKIHRFWR